MRQITDRRIEDREKEENERQVRLQSRAAEIQALRKNQSMLIFGKLELRYQDLAEYWSQPRMASIWQDADFIQRQREHCIERAAYFASMN